MERVGALIGKLKEQHEQNAGNAALSVTAQMLVAELQQQNDAATNSYKKVSVIMPARHVNGKVGADEKVVVIKEEKAEKEIPKQEIKEQNVLPEKESRTNNWMFDGAHEVPTLAQQQKIIYELNDTINTNTESSMNEKLREEKNEVANALQDAPVKDLKKAIGINDRYLFINELFRGDETMYERSIKTINSFSILPEAEYWILRELKLKLAWNENSTAVEHFDQLVKRRFS